MYLSFKTFPVLLDGIPIGHYAYPFQYPLPQEIPGMCITVNGKHV